MILEKRTYNRFTCDAPIWVVGLVSEFLIEVLSLNCSVNGLNFSSNYP
jgi:hypothetical protein